MKISKVIMVLFLGLVSVSCKNLRQENLSLHHSLLKLKESNDLLNEKLQYYENQNDSLVLISFDRTKTLYAGYPNLITITAPYHQEIKVESEYLEKLEKSGTYIITPRLDAKKHELIIHVKTKQGNWIEINNVYSVKKAGGFAVSVNSNYHETSMTKEKLEMAQFEIHSIDSCFDLELTVTRFDFKCPGQETITVHGNTLNQEAIEQLRKVKKDDVILISNVLCQSNFSQRAPEVKFPLAITIK